LCLALAAPLPSLAGANRQAPARPGGAAEIVDLSLFGGPGLALHLGGRPPALSD